MELKVEKEKELLSFLYDNLIHMSKNNIKNLLVNNCIYVNDRINTKYNYLLKNGDKVIIIDKYIKNSDFKRIEIIYEDKDMIVVNKPSNLLTIATTKEKEKTLYNIVSNYIKSKNKKNKIYIIHRLDRDTSGLIIFSKNKKFQELMQKDWNSTITLREYIALVHGKITNSKTLKNYISINNIGNTYLSDKNHGKLAITKYDVIKAKKNISLLKVEIKTGRKNQIRLQLANDNHPILGDKKYGIKDGFRKMYLHAYKLEFIHPLTKKSIKFKTLFPQDFNL